MLVEFRVSNFRSFGAEQTLSMVAGSTRRLPNNVISASVMGPRKGLRLLKAALVYGGNASGKSNLVRALECMERLVCMSATGMSADDPIPGVEPNRLASAGTAAPSRFEVLLCLDGVLYRYGFAASRASIAEEWLRVAVPNGPETTWFHRSGGDRRDWRFGARLRGRAKALSEETRPLNGLILSTAARLGLDSLEPLYRWFRGPALTANMADQPVALLTHQTARQCRDDHDLCSRVAALLRSADMGVASMRVDEQDFQFPDIPPSVDGPARGALEALRHLVSTRNSGRPRMLVPVTLHGTTGGPEAVEFALDDEASGTKRLFAIAGPVLGALGSGGTLFVDEIDASMHTLLVQQLLEVIQDPEVNDCGAQFVMTTHDTRLQTPELLRPDQIWLTEKTSGGATELYSLDDFAEGPRADAAFANGYLAGRYGAVPVFGNLRRAFLKARRNAQC